MPRIQFLTMSGCHNCEKAKEIFKEILPNFPDVKLEEIDMLTPPGQELVLKHGIMASPGIIIDGE
ncbi:MAG: thioredoxin family protein, partial [Candidatus Paceibacteria bacterium]